MSVPSRSIRQYSNTNIPDPDGRGKHPTSVVVPTGLLKLTFVNRRSVGPSCRSKGTELLPIGLAGFNGWFAFSSIPVPSSYSVTENVLDAFVVHNSAPNCGTLIHRILNAFTFAKPSAWTGNVHRFAPREAGLMSVHAGAILFSPARNSGTVGVLSVSPVPNVRLPLEFSQKPFHTQLAVPTGPPNANSKPP